MFLDYQKNDFNIQKGWRMGGNKVEVTINGSKFFLGLLWRGKVSVRALKMGQRKN